MNISITPIHENRINIGGPMPASGDIRLITVDSSQEVFDWTVRLVHYVRTEGRLPVIPGKDAPTCG
jgi:hypothetical protein